jgi:hypothetical protein
MPNSVLATAEGTSEINRRRLLGGLATVTAASATVGATAAIAATYEESPETEPLHPWERARNLAAELSAVLSEGDGAWGGPGGHWLAEVHPTGVEAAIAFISISAREWPRRNVTLPMQKVIDAHKAARETFNAACSATDEVELGKPASKAAQRRWKNASRAEEAALTAVCAFTPRGAADARAKAAYLMPFCRYGELVDYQIEALIRSGARS